MLAGKNAGIPPSSKGNLLHFWMGLTWYPELVCWLLNRRRQEPGSMPLLSHLLALGWTMSASEWLLASVWDLLFASLTGVHFVVNK
jgi:hypothetical protein